MKIKDWSKFQHFKDRTPPWIKLYRDLLDDPDWHELDGDSAKVLTMLWLIASEDETHQGNLPCTRKLAFRLRIKEDKLKQQLTNLSHWLIQSDIKSISSRYQDDAPETETETETETEKTIASSDESLLAVGSIPVQGGEFIVYSDFAAVLEEAYPAVDVAQTLKEIAAWCITNPTKKKTKRGAPAFLNRWFAKEQNRG